MNWPAGFGVEEYTRLSASTIANETRLKTASEFGPIKELKGFKKAFLQPGDSSLVLTFGITVTYSVRLRELAV